MTEPGHMKQTKRNAIPLVLLTALLTQGCEQPEYRQEPATLVVDLTAVARAVGKDDEINATLNLTREQLNSGLRSLLDTLNNDLDSAKKKLAEKSVKDNDTAYTQLAENAAARLQRSRQAAQLRLNDLQNELLDNFRARVRKTATEIAHQRGASMVRIAGADLLWFTPEADITGEVIARLRRKNSTEAEDLTSGINSDDQNTGRETIKLNRLVEQTENNP